MTIVFDKLPGNLEELKAMPQASLNEPEYGAALFLAVMMHYMVNKEETYEMLEFLKGPYGLSTYEKQFIRDRLKDAEEDFTVIRGMVLRKKRPPRGVFPGGIS